MLNSLDQCHLRTTAQHATQTLPCGERSLAVGSFFMRSVCHSHTRKRHASLAAVCLALLSLPVASLASPRTVDLYEHAASLTPVPERGAKLFRSHCSNCHGRAAGGNGNKVVPSLAGQLEAYLLKQLVDFVELDRDAPE